MLLTAEVTIVSDIIRLSWRFMKIKLGQMRIWLDVGNSVILDVVEYLACLIDVKNYYVTRCLFLAF